MSSKAKHGFWRETASCARRRGSILFRCEPSHAPFQAPDYLLLHRHVAAAVKPAGVEEGRINNVELALDGGLVAKDGRAGGGPDGPWQVFQLFARDHFNKEAAVVRG